MIDVCLLGTGGMMPLPRRFLTSMVARYKGQSIMIDCGEGTQVALKAKGWSPKPIDFICFTHFHADHISGLPGMLLTMGNAERTEPLTLIGPKGLKRVVESLRVIAPELPYTIEYIEVNEKKETLEFNGFQIEAFRVQHNVVCYGYSIVLPRSGKFQIEKAKELGLECRYWNALQKGQEVTIDGITYTPNMVMGEARKGLKVTYCTDTRPVEAIVTAAKEADLFICEGMYGEPEKAQKAKDHKHMTFYEAANLAKSAKVALLWLTHYSPSLVRPDEYMKDVKNIFPNAEAGKDGKTIELKFLEE
ncbi:MAG: ribonuclease Z [Eubacteriales bacterium]